MIPSADLRRGMAVRLRGEPYRVVSAEFHGGQGKMGGVTHARLESLRTGTHREWRFRAEEAVDTLELDKQAMQFLYADGGALVFMNPETFEQTSVPAARLGPAVRFVDEGMVLSVELLDGEPVGVSFPEIVEATVVDTTPPVHAQGFDNVWKEATLENGVAIQVPPFIAPGERVRVDVAAARYVERAKRR